MPVIYLDHAATSWPKPQPVLDAMVHFTQDIGANPGRSGHRLALEAGRVILHARDQLAALFHVLDPARIAFTKNATEALNVALYGLLRPGDRVVTSAAEHNALMRPLRWLEAARQVSVVLVPCDATGVLDLDALRRELAVPTRLVALTHASNITGVINPLAAVARLAHEAGACLLVDAAQTAGSIDIDAPGLGIDVLAFTGHKSLLGPTGTGGLYVSDAVELPPLMRGGTGSESDHEWQPALMPDRLESGTLNAVGIAGLGAGAAYVLAAGVTEIHRRQSGIVSRLIDGLRSIAGVSVYGPADVNARAGVVAFNVAGCSPDRVALSLDESFDVMVRVGLHCAPAAHRTLGTFPTGAVRFSVGFGTSPEEIDAALTAVASIASGHGTI